jgi:hypothetical protein
MAYYIWFRGRIWPGHIYGKCTENLMRSSSKMIKNGRKLIGQKFVENWFEDGQK